MTRYALSNACTSPHIFSPERAEVIYFSHSLRSRPYTRFKKRVHVLRFFLKHFQFASHGDFGIRMFKYEYMNVRRELRI